MSDDAQVACVVKKTRFGRCRTSQLSDLMYSFETEKPLSMLTSVRVVRRNYCLKALLINEQHREIPMEKLGGNGRYVAERIHDHGHVHSVLFKEPNLVVVTTRLPFFWDTLFDHILACLGSRFHEHRTAVHANLKQLRRYGVPPVSRVPGGTRPFAA